MPAWGRPFPPRPETGWRTARTIPWGPIIPVCRGEDRAYRVARPGGYYELSGTPRHAVMRTVNEIGSPVASALSARGFIAARYAYPNVAINRGGRDRHDCGAYHGLTLCFRTIKLITIPKVRYRFEALGGNNLKSSTLPRQLSEPHRQGIVK